MSAVALGPGAEAAARELAAAGVAKVYVSEAAHLRRLAGRTPWPPAWRRSLPRRVPPWCLCGSTRRGKETAPRLAQKLGAGCVTDVNSLMVDDGELIAGRYAFGGATVAREKLSTAVKVFAVMPKTFSTESDAGVVPAGVIVDQYD